MKRASLRVVKLGGSLLDVEGLRGRLLAWLRAQKPKTTALVVGGGPIADAIRAIDRAQALSPEAAHWLAIDAMGVTARLTAELFPEFPLLHSLPAVCPAAVQGAEIGDVVILDALGVLRAAAPADALPASWSVTSDSIAAWMAGKLAADELVLLKSKLPHGELDLKSLADEGYVDAFFPRAAAKLECVRLVNLRDASYPERVAISVAASTA